MKPTGQLVLVFTVMFGLGSAAAIAGPCNTGKSAEMRDAGSGPTPGNTGTTVGTNSASTAEHPPTSAMNQQAAGGPTSSQDAQRQMQGQPTAAQQAAGASSGSASGNDC